MIAPVLLSTKVSEISDFTKALQTAYGSFGVAWRILDDIRDIAEDIEKGTESSVYLCLPDSERAHWKKNVFRNQGAARDATAAILNRVLEGGILDTLKKENMRRIGSSGGPCRYS